MKRFRPYLPILWTLVLNLVNLLWRIARQIALPGPRKTGNLLTSLFLVFAGLVEQAAGCRRAVIAVSLDPTIKIRAWKTPAWSHCKIWLRRGMLVAAWALFILSSFELGGTETREPRSDHSSQTVAIAAMAEVTAPLEAERSGFDPASPGTTIDRPLSVKPRIKRWLFLRTLRI